MSRTLPLLLVAVLGAACIDEPCDPEQRVSRGVCLPVLVVPDAGGDDDAAPAASVPFNAACATTDECGGETDYCAVLPGQTVGFCTHTGCLEDETVCPEGMTCVDLGPYGAPGMSLCYGGAS